MLSSVGSAGSIVLAIVLVSLLIVIHEFGHFLVARWCKMRVLRFSLGFGRPLVEWKRGETTYQIAMIPLGGYVQIAGMNPQEEVEPQDPSIYPNRPAWQRLLTIFAGPFANYATAIVLVFVYFMVFGMPTAFKPGIAMVVPGSPSATAGLQDGDVLVSINGQPIDRPEAVLPIVERSGGKPLNVVVRRDDQERRFVVTPAKQAGAYRMGILPDDIPTARRAAGIGESAVNSLRFPAVQTVVMLHNLYNMVSGKIRWGELKRSVSGPVGIVRVVAKTTRAGAGDAFQIIALISVALGLFNLLPIPALDGGRLVFLGYELVTRRRVRPSVEAAVHMVGFVLLLGLLLAVTYKDITGCH